MKNAHIKPGELVPAEIRLEVYKEALAILKDNEYRYLCVMLPMLLWDLDFAFDAAPCGKEWSHHQSLSMFPEIAEGVKKIKPSHYTKKPRLRIETLQSAIAKLERQLNKTTV